MTDSIVNIMTPTRIDPADIARIARHNIAACRRQNALRAEGKMPVFNHRETRSGGALRISKRNWRGRNATSS